MALGENYHSGRMTCYPEVMWHVARRFVDVQEGGFEGPENGPKQRRINNRLLSYRPKSKNGSRILAGGQGPAQLQPLRRSDSVIGSRERRMCLINSCFGSFCERKQIRMAFFSSPKGSSPGLPAPWRGPARDPRSRKGSFLRMNVWPTDVKVRAARPLGINEERREFPPRSDVSRMPSFCHSAPRA